MDLLRRVDLHPRNGQYPVLRCRRKNRRVEMIISGRNLEEEKLGDAITQFITQSQGGADQQNP